MKRRFCLLLWLCTCLLPLAAAEKPVIKHLLSFDFGLLLRGASHGGLGFGVQYERQVIPHLAGKGYFGHSIFNTDYNDLFCVTVDTGLYGVWYPFSTQLRGLYVDAGGGFDYISYLGEKEKIERYFADKPSGMVLFVAGDLGYKFSLPKNFLLDLSLGYKYVYDSDITYVGTVGEVISDGLRFSVKLKHVGTKSK